jgi:hypothetical protein
MGSCQNVCNFNYMISHNEIIVESKLAIDAIGYDSCPDSVSSSSNPLSVDVPVEKYLQTV